MARDRAVGSGGRLALLVAVLATIGCDRVTKQIAGRALAGAGRRSFLGDTLRLEYAENTGGFLSLGAGLPVAARTALFTIGTALLLALGIAAAVRGRWSGRPLLGLALVVAGGASNWIDRLAHGSVVDFVNVGLGPLRTGIFNVADVAVLAGAGILVLEGFRRE